MLPDHSPKYVRMCRLAEHVQDDWLPSIGDWYADMTATDEDSRARLFLLSQFSSGEDGGIVYVNFSHTTNFANSMSDFKHGRYWLPAPTDLESYIIRIAPAHRMKQRFKHWSKVQGEFHSYNEGGYYDSPGIFELDSDNAHCETVYQLWLCFVMSELFGQRWDAKFDNDDGGWVHV